MHVQQILFAELFNTEFVQWLEVVLVFGDQVLQVLDEGFLQGEGGVVFFERGLWVGTGFRLETHGLGGFGVVEGHVF